jgi:hypothetical protein
MLETPVVVGAVAVEEAAVVVTEIVEAVGVEAAVVVIVIGVVAEDVLFRVQVK